MKVFLALVFGVALGVGGLWLYTHRSSPAVQEKADQVETAARSAANAVQDQLKALHLNPQDLKDELAASGRVIRRKAEETGKAVADATADARITAAIKTKLLTSSDLSALNISVNTTTGVVTLSGPVPSVETISKAVLLALQTDGVREVISTLQVVKPRNGL